MRRGVVLLTTVVLLATAAAARSAPVSSSSPETAAGAASAALASDPGLGPLSYAALLEAARRRLVRAAIVDPRASRLIVTLANGDTRVVYYPLGEADALAVLHEADVDVAIARVPRRGASAGVIVIGVVGFIALVALLAMGAAGWSRRKARTTRSAPAEADAPPVSTTRFADVAGCDDAVLELRDTLDFLRDPARFCRLGARLPSGIILHGPPGTGKTLLARAVAGEAQVPFLARSATDFVELYVGVGAKRIRELFQEARQSERGAVVFIDELDAVGRRRAAQPGSSGETENTLNALLVELDGFRGRGPVICVAATNRLDMLDDALLRPGRFGLQVRVDLPDERGRLAILELHASQTPLADDVDLAGLAAYTAGSSGAQLADMINQAAILATRRHAEAVADCDLREGHLRVLAGPERASSMLTDEERRLVAWHEAGHVLAAEVLTTQDKAQRVTIQPRGRAAGLAVYGQTDRALHSRRYLEEKMTCLLAGRAAEQLLVGELSSGAANDLQQANMLARIAVLELGFSDRVGQIIGYAHGAEVGLADATRRIVDEEVERLVADAYRHALELLQIRRAELDALGEALLQRRQLERVDILLVLSDRRERPPIQRTPRPDAERLPVPLPEPVPVPVPRPRTEGRLVAVARRLEQRRGRARTPSEGT